MSFRSGHYNAPVRIVSVSGACSRAGKTALAESLLRALPAGRAAAVKFTTTEDVFERCPRGSACVVCDIDVPFRIVRDPAVLREPGTDTDRLAAAGRARGGLGDRPGGGRAPRPGRRWRGCWRRRRSRWSKARPWSSSGSPRPDLRLFVVHPSLSPDALEADLGRA